MEFFVQFISCAENRKMPMLRISFIILFFFLLSVGCIMIYLSFCGSDIEEQKFLISLAELSNGNEVSKLKAIESLEFHGKKSLPALVAALDDQTSFHVQIRAAKAVALIDANNFEARRTFAALLTDASHVPVNQRCLAMHLIVSAFNNDDEWDQIFTALLSDPEDVIRASAAQAIRRFGDIRNRPITPLIGLLSDQSDAVKLQSIQALGAVGPRAATAVPDLIRLLGAKDEQLVLASLQALGRIRCDPNKGVTNALIPLLKNANSKIRSYAAQTLHNLDVEAGNESSAL